MVSVGTASGRFVRYIAIGIRLVVYEVTTAHHEIIFWQGDGIQKLAFKIVTMVLSGGSYEIDALGFGIHFHVR